MESYKYPMVAPEIVERVFNIASEVSGCSVDLIKHGGRKRPYPLLRYLVAYTFMSMGMGPVAAGRATGLNHSTICHGYLYVRDLKSGYGLPNEKELERKFTNKVEMINNHEQIVEAEKCIGLLNECREHLDNARFRMGSINPTLKHKLDAMYDHICKALDQVY